MRTGQFSEGSPGPGPGCRFGWWLRVGWLGLLLQRPLTGQEESLSYKFQDYREEAGRVQVRSHYGLLQKELGSLGRVELMGLIDTISGASPTGEAPYQAGGPVPLGAAIEDERRAGSVEWSRAFGRFTLAPLFYYSEENDYVSNGYALNTTVDFNRKNTTLALGWAYSDDAVYSLAHGAWMDKRVTDLLAGLTQVLDPRTVLTVNLTYGRSRGYLSDPYKVISAEIELAPGLVLPQTPPENRPDHRSRWIVLTTLHRALPGLAAAVEGSYRYFEDDAGTDAHTFEVKWFQNLGERWILQPFARHYRQGAADFYRPTLVGTDVTWTYLPTGQAPYYSSDYRLSRFDSWNYGLKAVCHVTDRLDLDLTLERYEMSGRDDRTPASAFIEATLLTAGARLSF